MNISAKRVLKFALLPGILPLLRDLFATGFGPVALFMAQIYGAVRLLPSDHPYLNPANQGRFGVRQVIAAAAANLKFRRENMDQVLIFIVLLIGIVILVLQFVLLGLSFFMHRAHAATMPTSFAGIFGTPTSASGRIASGNDLAFVLLDRVFGVANIFVDNGGNSTCVALNQACMAAPTLNPTATGDGQFPWPYHKALQSVFGFYSDGLLVVAMIIVLYFIVAVAAETAQTGTPFGQRFSRVWAPIRLVVALGLLLPIGNGLNSAQYIVLYAAKWGSGFATNGWLMFANEALPRSASGVVNGENMVAIPNPPALTNLLEYATVLDTCWSANINMKQPDKKTPIFAYFIGQDLNNVTRQQLSYATTYQDALTFYNGQDIRIVFGSCQMKNDATGEVSNCDTQTLEEGDGEGNSYSLVYANEPGGVSPICGEIDMKTLANGDPGGYSIQSQYFSMVLGMWFTSPYTGIKAPAANSSPANWQIGNWADQLVKNYQSPTPVLPAKLVKAADVTAVHNAYDTNMQAILQKGVDKENNVNFYNNVEPLGWAGAAIWYNKIAEMNGTIVSAADSLPTVGHYPEVMEQVRAAKAQSSTQSSGPDVFEPSLADNHAIELKGDNALAIAKVLDQAHNLWASEYIPTSNNTIEDFVKNLFGLHGLFDMQKQTNVNPLAQLSMLGKTLVERGALLLKPGKREVRATIGDIQGFGLIGPNMRAS